MKNTNVLKSLLIFSLLALCAGRGYADGEVPDEIQLNSELTVSITKGSSSHESGTIDVTTGVNSGGVVSYFDIETNGTDDDYDFYLTSTFPIDGTACSGYFGDAKAGTGYILLGNTAVGHKPTEDAVSKAKTGVKGNKNVIAYPVTISTSGNMDYDYNSSHATYGSCYKITLNGDSEGTVTHRIGTSPAVNTYEPYYDAAGTYQATITLTAISK